jgi:hypothetical protein
VVLPAGDHDRIGCFTDQVKLTHALVQDLDEAVKEVKLLGEHEEESSQKITELEATLEGMVESHDELIMEIAKEIALDRMGEDAEDEDEDEDGNNEGDATAPPVAMAPPFAPTPPVATAPEEVVEEEDPIDMVPEQEASVAHEVVLADAEPELPHPYLYCTLMRDYEESPSRMMDD